MTVPKNIIALARLSEEEVERNPSVLVVAQGLRMLLYKAGGFPSTKEIEQGGVYQFCVFGNDDDTDPHHIITVQSMRGMFSPEEIAQMKKEASE